MPPSYNAEVKEISQRMAHLSALLDIPRPTSEFKILWFEYRDLKTRRKVIEEPGSIPARHDVDDEPTDIQGMLSIESPRLQLWLRYEQVHKIRHNPATARS
jgi:hypothetical protein